MINSWRMSLLHETDFLYQAMSTKRMVQVVFLSVIGCTLVMYGPLGWDWITRLVKANQVKSHLAVVRQTIPVPKDVTELRVEEFVSTGYFLGPCALGSLRLIYGTERSWMEVLEDYHNLFTQIGWILNSSYNGNEFDRRVYDSKDPNLRVTLDIPAAFAPFDEIKEQFSTLYVFWLSYRLPAPGCYEG